MNPVSKLYFFLSNDGLTELRSRFSPPEGAFNIEYSQDKETYRYSYFSHPDNEELEYTLSFPIFLKSELEKLLGSVLRYIDERIISINPANERKEFILPIITKLNFAIDNWLNLPSTSQYIDTIAVLKFFKTQIISQLAPFLENNITLNERKVEARELDLPEEFKLPVLKRKIKALDIRQSALLFHYLKEHDAILPYKANSLARLVHSLTGHSEQNLRTIEGYGVIWDIIQDKVKDENFNDIENYNLISVREVLLRIIDDINSAISDNQKFRKK